MPRSDGPSNQLAGASHRVAVTYLIDEGTQVHISDVAFLGNDHTKLGFLQRNTSVKAEAPLNEAKLLGSESSLYNLGIFDWVNVAPRRPITDQQTEEVQVKVHEAKRNSLTLWIGAALYTGGRQPFIGYRGFARPSDPRSSQFVQDYREKCL